MDIHGRDISAMDIHSRDISLPWISMVEISLPWISMVEISLPWMEKTSSKSGVMEKTSPKIRVFGEDIIQKTTFWRRHHPKTISWKRHYPKPVSWRRHRPKNDCLENTSSKQMTFWPTHQSKTDFMDIHGPWLNKIFGCLDTFIVNVFAGVRGRLAPAFVWGGGGGGGGYGGRQPPASWYGSWTMVHFPWSMVLFCHHFHGKIVRSTVFLQYIGALWELIRLSSGSKGSSGNRVRNHRSDPFFHGQEFSDDGSSQQTPSNYHCYYFYDHHYHFCSWIFQFSGISILSKFGFPKMLFLKLFPKTFQRNVFEKIISNTAFQKNPIDTTLKTHS